MANIMKGFRRIHGRQTPHGLELQILKRLPRIALLGSLLPLALSGLVRVIPSEAGADRAKHIKSVDIFAISTEVTFLTAILTVAIGCVVVYIMKGPAYGADSYPVEHSDNPVQRDPPEHGKDKR
jgi:hypothetical protein